MKIVLVCLCVGVLMLGCWGVGMCPAHADEEFLVPLSHSPSHSPSGFIPFYWITGKLENSRDQVAQANQHFSYLFESSPEAGFAGDVVGPQGQSGQDKAYMINAFDLPVVNPVTAGKTYRVGIARDDRNYGAGPVQVTISGNGYDTAPDMLLALAEGPPFAGVPNTARRHFAYHTRDTTYADNPYKDLIARYGPGGPGSLAGRGISGAWAGGILPRIEDIFFGNRAYAPDIERFVVDEAPLVKARVTSPSGVDTQSLRIVLNQGTALSKTLAVGPASLQSQRLSTPQSDEPTRTLSVTLSHQVEKADALSAGKQTVTLRASNEIGTTEVMANVEVLSGPPVLVTLPQVGPAPYSPLRGDETGSKLARIFYTLNVRANIEILIFSGTGQMIQRFAREAGTEGGNAGGNRVDWDGVTLYGDIIGNGIYDVQIFAKDEMRLLGKAKLVVFN